MEFISNLIKRPVSLVSGGGEVTDKPQESPTSRPTTIGSFENEENKEKDLKMEKEQQQTTADDSTPRPNSTSRPTTIGSLEDVEILQNKINSLENMEISQEELNSFVKGVQEMENMEVHQKAGGGVVPMENKQQIKTNGKHEEIAFTQKNCVVENSNRTQNQNQDPIGCDLNQNETGDKNVTKEKSPDLNNHAKDSGSCDEQQKHLETLQKNVEQGKTENLKNEDQVLEGQNVSDVKQGDLKNDIPDKNCEDTDNRDSEFKNLNNPENLQNNVMEEKCTDLNNKDKVIEGQNISQEEINKDMLHKICQSTESKDQESENQTNPENPQINVEDITQERAEEKATEIDNTNEEFKKCAASEEQGQMSVQTPTENEESNNSKNSQNIENRKSDAPSSNTEEKEVLDVTEEVEAKAAVGISQIPSNVKIIERELPNSQEASSEKQEDIINSPGAGEQEIPQQLKLEDISAINNQESCQNLNSPHQQSQIQENINKQKENEAQGNILTQNTLEESQTEVKSNDKEKKAEEIPLNLQDNSKGSSEPNRGSQENQSENNSNAEPQELQQTNKDLPNSCDEMPKPQIEISYYEHQEATERPITSLTSSLNGNITDFIGVPEEILKEFDEEYLPPPPPPLLLPPDDDSSMQSQTPSPPPPPPVLTSSMTASQTIDELLSEITDNLTLAGINDEVLAIASPPQKSEHSPLSSKNSLNNSKTTPKTPTNNGAPQQTTAAGPAATSPAVFEANSTLHKFHVDPDLATGLFDDHQQQTAAMESQNTSGVAANKSSNKFVGLTEFDEAKIPELPGDLNPNIEVILNPSDFDYLLTKGNNNTPVDRSSLLLKFDPLLGCPVPVNQGQQTQQQQQQLHLQIPTNLNNNPCLSPTIEEDELNESTNRSFVVDNARTSLGSSGGVGGFGRSSVTGPALSSSAKLLKERSQEVKQQLLLQQQQQNKRQLPQPGTKKNATMSVDVIKDMSLDNNDCNKTFENSNSTQPDDKQINYKMDELEKKVKNEVLKTEDIEKKLREAEQREEALIKRITEKDKTVAKMTGVIEAYEKAIAELIAEKEQLIQNYEKQLAEVKADRDSNYHHLTSLETTFSDLHVKYEKSKEMTCQLKGNEENLIAENRKNAENLRLQEQRYDKMKNHAMQQLEIANKKLEALAREHQLETTKLKALLKKEEIARSSMSEQLAQKSKENAELVKICDELISGQGS
uniref:Transforming acidic coiled-coil-containing protein C-terminal domain-containing protein n=1 Tax=Musca domestica TaxID=7370 RepID=A0A1I8MLZ0_MUSDO